MFALGALPLKVNGLGTGAVQLGARLADIGFRHDAGLVLVFRQLQRTCIGGHGGVEQTHLLIQHTQLQVALGQFRLQAQAHGGQIGGAGLEAGIARLQAAAQFAPHIQLPGRIQAEVIALGDLRGVGTTDADAIAGAQGAATTALPRPLNAGTARQGRIKRCSGAAEQGAGLAILRLGSRQILVGDIQLADQLIQLGVAIQLPPGVAQLLIAWRGSFPAGGFLELRRNSRVRALIIGANGASAEQQCGTEQAQTAKGQASHCRISIVTPAPAARVWRGHASGAAPSDAGGRGTDTPRAWCRGSAVGCRSGHRRW